MRWHNKVFTCKWPARLIAILVVVFLVFASILYFYDTLFAALKKFSENHISSRTTRALAWAMAITIGLGIFAESAVGIWNTLIYWGQRADNWLIKRFYGREYFLDEANKLLTHTRAQLNRVNLSLQTLTHELCQTKPREFSEKLKKLSDECQEIKTRCLRMHKILEGTDAYDVINLQRQEQAKTTLNTLVTENLHVGDRIEMLLNKCQTTETK